MSVELRHTPINGVLELTAQTFIDHRGLFLNAFRSQEPVFQQAWGDRSISQVNLSFTKVVGTIRGLHLQAEPYSEAKLVRCLKGRVWDVAVDLRSHSQTYCQWHATELSADQANALLIPEGCAHGFQVLEPGSELLYLHSGDWIPEAETGIFFADPILAIQWPMPAVDMTDRDCALPFLNS